MIFVLTFINTEIDTPLRPIVSSIRAAATGVSQFLDITLRPLFDQLAKQTTFINGIDFIRKLKKYRDSGRLLPTTNFITFDVTDLNTMIPRQGALQVLERFLCKHSKQQDGKINNM